MRASTPDSPAGTPMAEFAADVDLARRMLQGRHPDLADREIRVVASGWDNAIFRLGDDLALRLPRRKVAVRLIRNEQRWLPGLARRLPLRVPAPVRIGAPDQDFPWPWSVIPWIEGETADISPPDGDQGVVLARFFEALHRPAPKRAPRNPHRGVPLAQRAQMFEARAAGLAARGRPIDPAILAIWADALAAPDDAAPTWIQGDPHPRNVLVRDGRIVAVIDWGDMAQGDRASDLAAIWMLLPSPRARREAIAALPAVTPATWRRARGWAALYVAMLMDAGLADDPRMTAIAERTAERLIEGV
jgi:aminoglycoside phosphotransferase (APT) family kinase protein